ncbi:MAG: type II secretion system protein [Parachlamydiaceae bacterium]|nr:type II secretion system protein [Parachlamydiaceae bacterium]
MKIKRRHVTLLEILLVLAILGIVGGIMGINIRKALHEQRFKSEVEVLINQLRLAQELMLIFNGDLYLTLDAAQDGIVSKINLEQPLASWTPPQKSLSHKFTTIRRISLYPPPVGDTSKGALIKFMSGGAIMTKGILRMSTAEQDGPGVLSRYLCLPGYPAPLASVARQLTEEECLTKDEAFDAQLTGRTMGELKVEKGVGVEQ